MSGFRFDDLDDLPLPITPQDAKLIGRSNQVYKAPLHGKILVPPTLSTFSTSFDDTANSSAKSFTDNSFGIRMSKTNTTTGNVNDWGACYKSVPSGTTWTATCLMQRRYLLRERFMNGFILRESSTGKMAIIGWFHAFFYGGIGASFLTSDGDFVGDGSYQVLSSEAPEFAWFRIHRDNSASQYVFSYSIDGDYWMEVYRIGLTGGGIFTTAANHIGFGVNSNCKAPLAPIVTDVLHYEE